jgi:hypothetical protein
VRPAYAIEYDTRWVVVRHFEEGLNDYRIVLQECVGLWSSLGGRQTQSGLAERMAASTVEDFSGIRLAGCVLIESDVVAVGVFV